MLVQLRNSNCGRRGFFDNINHNWLLRMLRERIDDAAFLNLIGKWPKAGILDTDGEVIHPESGTPQGGIVSPVLANALRGSEYNRGTGCGKTARPGLCGGLRVTGVPTARDLIYKWK